MLSERENFQKLKFGSKSRKKSNFFLIMPTSLRGFVIGPKKFQNISCLCIFKYLPSLHSHSSLCIAKLLIGNFSFIVCLWKHIIMETKRAARISPWRKLPRRRPTVTSSLNIYPCISWDKGWGERLRCYSSLFHPPTPSQQASG
jgi:hypothetical protein